MKRLLSVFLTIAMLAGLVPAQVFASDDADLPQQVIELPVLESAEPLGAEAPLASVSPNVVPEGGVFVYQGSTEFRSYSYVYILDDQGDPIDSMPEENGVLQMVDSDGNVAATSLAVNYVSLWDSELDRDCYGIQHTEFESSAEQDLTQLPAGVYTLRLYAGNDIYACSGTIEIVGSDALLIDSASVSNFYSGVASWDLSLSLYGFQSEEDLDALTFTMVDADGNVVGTSSNRYRDFNVRESNGVLRWKLYEEMLLADGCTLENGVTYTLQISYSGEQALYSAVSSVTNTVRTPSIQIEGLTVKDAQRSVVDVVFSNWDTTEIYTVTVSTNDNAPVQLAQWTGTISDSGKVELTLTRTGNPEPMTSMDSWFYVEVSWGSGSRRSTSLENPYYNLSSGGTGDLYLSGIARISASATQWTATLTGYNSTLYQRGGDLMTLVNSDGEEVARTTDFEELRYDAYFFEISADFRFAKPLPTGWYELYFNGEYIEDIRVLSSLSWSISIPFSHRDNNTQTSSFAPKLGIFPITIHAINSSGKGTLTICNEDGDTLLTSGLLTGTESEYSGHKDFVWTLDAEDFQEFIPGERYYLLFTDRDSDLDVLDCELGFYVTDAILPDFSTDEAYHIAGYYAKPGDTALAVNFYTHDLLNITMDALSEITNLVFYNQDTDETFTGTALTNGRWADGYYQYYADLTLNAPLTAGYYAVQYNGQDVNWFSVREPEVVLFPTVNGNLEESGLIYGQGLPADGVYTGKFYNEYTCLTETPITLTYEESEDGDTYLRCDMELVKALDLPVGSYELRLWLNGKPLGNASYEVLDNSLPVVEIYDIYDSWLTASNFSGWYAFSILNGGAYTRIRASEDLALLAEEEYVSAARSEFRLSAGYGEKTIYAQLQTTDELTESEVLTFKLWYYNSEEPLELVVPEDIQGIYGSRMLQVTIGTETPYFRPVMEVETSYGATETIPLNYVGKGQPTGLYPPAVHGLESAHPFVYVASDDNYSNYYEQTWTYTEEGATSLRLTFSPATDLKDSAHLYLYSGSGDEKEFIDSFYSYHTDDIAGQTLTVPGDTVTIVMKTSRSSDPCYGFAVTDVEAVGIPAVEVVSMEEDVPAVEDVPVEEERSLYLYATDLLDSESYEYDLQDCETVRFYLVDQINDVVSEVVERMLIFGNPDEIILPQFREQDYYYEDVYWNSSTYPLYGYATPGSTVTVSNYDGTVATATANTYGYFTVDLTGLADDYHAFTVEDDSGVTDATDFGFYVDTVAPVIESVNFTFGDTNAATLRWVCENDQIDHFVILKNNVVLSKNVSATSRTYSVAASADDGNFFTVRAVDKAGNVGELTVSTADQVPPTAPESVTASNVTTSSVELAWTEGTDNIGIMGYVVYCNGEELVRLDGADTLSYTASDLLPGTDYSFTVKSRDKAGNLSVASAAAEITTVDLIVTPSLESAYIVDAYPGKRIPLSVTVTADTEGYTPYLTEAWFEFRLAGEDAEWTYGTLNSLSLTGNWDISGSDKDGYLPKGSYELYFYAVDGRAIFRSEPVSVVILKADDIPPTAPGIPTARSHTTTSIRFGWTAATDNIAVASYNIYRDGEQIANTSNLEWTDSGLDMGTYTYTVQAVDGRGNLSAHSAAAQLSTMVLEFDSTADLADSYVLEDQAFKSIDVWARFKAQEGYAPAITMSMEYRAQGSQTWTSAPMSAGITDANYFTGSWDISGDVLGYLPTGIYEVRFAVTDGSATAYSDVQNVTLCGETEAPVITYTTPVTGQTYGGKDILVTASASDNVSVASVSLYWAAEGSDRFTLLGSSEGSYASATWDASRLPSGNYTVKAVAADLRGNEGERIFNINVDNTPPAVPTGVTLSSTSRYIFVNWGTDYSLPSDFLHFRVYRATDADGPFEIIRQLSSVGYYDDGKTADAGVTYYYYVTAVDVYGNESAAEKTVSGSFVPDTESPEIGDMLPRANAGLRKSVALKITAADNYRLAKAVFSYRLKGASQWIEIAEIPVSGITNNTVFAFDWTIPAGITKGTYEIRAQVYDDSINDVSAGYAANQPAELIRTVTISPYTAPVAPAVSVSADYKRADFTWTYGGDTETLKDFVLYQTNAAGGDRAYVTSAVKGSTGECSAAIPASGTQYFVVVARDVYGAEKASAVLSVTSAPRETEPPVAVLQPETLTAAAGVPFAFSAVNSTDNDEIVSYAWNFGDGTTGNGAACKHTYAAAGTYTVVLTVTDACGNVGTATAAMTVYDVTAADADHALITVTTVNAYVSGTPAVADAEIRITAANEDGVTVFETSLVSGEDGKATVVVPVGDITVSAIAQGFVSTSRTVTVEPGTDGTFAYTLGLTPMNVSMVDGSLTVEEMTYGEILAAGIDVTDPDNNHVWKFAATLEFVAAPAFPFDLPDLPVTGYFNGNGKFLGGTGWGWCSVGGGGGGGGGGTGWGMNIGIFPISENFILVIYGEAHWLKEMYNVELLVINNSYTDDITDCKASLMLPDGLSLAAMTGKQQDLTIDLGTIPHKDDARKDANTAKANWYVRGDKEGEYNLTASVIGRNPEIFVKSFTTDKPVKVYAGSALKLFIKAEDIAYRGEEYHVQFKLQNVSHKSLYNLSFGITGAEQFKVLTMGDDQAELLLTHEDFEDNMTRGVDVLLPGGSITIDFYTTVWFNSLLELADLGPLDVGYYLTNVFVTTLEGSTTTIPYEVEIVRSSHGTFFEWLVEEAKELADDTLIDLLEKELLDEIPLISTAKKIFEFASHGEADSRCVIQIEGGYVTASNNFLRRSAPAMPTGAVAVYTDAEQYTVSEDGKTLTLLSDGKIYVEGKKAGEATLTVTTTANEGTQENVHTLHFSVDRGTVEADDLILQAPAVGLTDGKAAIPLAGSTLDITFPYVLVDADGGYLTTAKNAQWSVSGADTDGITVKNGIVTVQSHAKAGDYTVTLVVGEKTASQPFTLTREASVAQSVAISSGTAVLGDSYLLPMDDGAFTFGAQVFDQYGVVFDTPVIWQADGSSAVATAVNGKVTPGSTAGTLELTVSVSGNTALTDTITVVVMDADDLSVTETSDESGYTATVANGGSQTVTLQAMAAAYDANGRMVTCVTRQITVEAGAAEEVSLTYPAGKQVSEVKLFLVNAASLQPVAAAR